ncbi:MAG TPA: RdgB/HAM1 family non-canonical purine NTP pyrophosphatase [Alphaproteobacteria bacterium]|jgi:XTP/dITP diphosphohydrolase
MRRRSIAGRKIVLASHNPGKLREIAELLAPYKVEVVSAGDLGLREPDETGATFIDNAVIKAEAAAMASGLPALADDSGLAVDALGGAPGIHSARWAGPAKDFGMAMERVWREASQSAPNTVQGHAGPDRNAHFVCVLALCWPALPFGAPVCDIFPGRVDGHLVWPPRGEKGFGYDPIFMAKGHSQTFGEMEASAKHAISHRADAFNKLVAAYFS